MKYFIAIVLSVFAVPTFAKVPTGFRATPSGPAIAIISEKEERIAEIQDIHNLSKEEATLVTLARLLSSEERLIVSGSVMELKEVLPKSIDEQVSSIAKTHELDLDEAYLVAAMRYDAGDVETIEFIQQQVIAIINEIAPLAEK